MLADGRLDAGHVTSRQLVEQALVLGQDGLAALAARGVRHTEIGDIEGDAHRCETLRAQLLAAEDFAATLRRRLGTRR